MSTFVMPSLGADMQSAVLMEWKVKEGDSVKKGDVIAEVETSKGVIEIEVFEDGIVEKVLVPEETEAKVGTPLAIIRSLDKSTEIEEPAGPDMAAETKEAEPSPTPDQPIPDEPDEPVEIQRVKSSPLARKKAKELGIELSSLAEGDKPVHLAQVESQKVSGTTEMGGMRQAIAKAMSRSNAEIPHYYLSTSINMTAALHWLEELNKNRAIEDRILPAALLIRAVVRTLQEVPQLNGFWRDDALHLSEAVNPGIAIALRREGLITPALLNAEHMDLDGTMHALSDLITRTRSGKLRSSEITQQTITITNLGDLGVERVYGVIYPPQVALVGFGRILDTPWAEGDTLSVRKVMQATLAGDHRATDGRTGGEFLNKLDQILQTPEELL
ncbi:MAG TPA: 2-oxo acid dehydrogenase subunit E2 [Epsilonproteobacteria bacterium]|nr:2-oxo acid dehydrogenase subunit E2 [Campylobacterota bacterium]